VYVFVKPTGGWSSGTQAAKLSASDGAMDDSLGVSVGVSADGSTVVAGAAATVSGHFEQGAVYVFVKPTGGWSSGTQAAKLTASDGAGGDLLGVSVGVSADGSAVVAGAAATVGGHIGQGAVYVFVKPAGGWSSGTQAAKLSASDGAGGDLLGVSVGVSADGSTVVAGAPQPTVGSKGAVYVFVKPAGGWSSGTQAAKLTASDGAGGDSLGRSVGVSADGSTVVAGAPYATVRGKAGVHDADSNQGAVYVFVKPAGGWSSGTQAAKLTASDGAGGDLLGWSVGMSTDGSTVVAGAPTISFLIGQGAVYVFVKPAGGWSSGTQAAKLTASDGTAGDQAGLGWSVGISSDGSTVVAGAPQGALRSSPPGAAYVFGSGTPTAAVAPLGHARVVGTTVSVPISCTGPRGASCQATLTLNIVETLKGGTVIAVTANKSKPAKTTKKLLTLGSTRVGIAAGKSKTVRLTLNSTGKRLLAARHRVRAKLTLAQTGASATSTIVTFTAKTKARPIAH